MMSSERDQVHQRPSSAADVHLITEVDWPDASTPASGDERAGQDACHRVRIVPDGIRREAQHYSVLDRELIRSIKIAIPVQHIEVWNSVDLDGKRVILPIGVEVIPSVDALNDMLANGFRQAMPSSDSLEVDLWDRLDSAFGIIQCLDNQGMPKTRPATSQRLP